MTNIVHFPRAKDARAVEPTRPMPGTFRAEGRAVLGGLVGLVWLATLLVWPILKWLLSVEVFFQFVRMLYHWNTPGIFAGWTFLLHFALLTGITYFVSIYKPKGV